MTQKYKKVPKKISPSVYPNEEADEKLLSTVINNIRQTSYRR